MKTLFFPFFSSFTGQPCFLIHKITDTQTHRSGGLMKNKAGYTATLVACGWAGAMMENSLGHFGRSSELKTLKNPETVKWGPTNQPIDQPTDGRTDGQSGV